MDKPELIRTTADIIYTAIADNAGAAVEAATSVGGFVVGAGGEAVVGHLAVAGVGELWKRLKAGQANEEIEEDFDQTSHGQALFQEALRAMMSGIDEDRAEAVLRAFIGLAKQPPKDALERAEQLHVLRVTSTLTTWEVIAINQLERFRLAVRIPGLESRYMSSDGETRGNAMQTAKQHRQYFEDWLKREGDMDQCQRGLLVSEGIAGLHRKRLLWGQKLDDEAEHFVFNPRGKFSALGWKVVQHLYSA